MNDWNEDDEDRIYDTFCPECGENAPLSPVSGYCYDCENALSDEDDVEDPESEDEEEICEECGMSFPPDCLEDGVCALCLDEEE